MSMASDDWRMKLPAETPSGLSLDSVLDAQTLGVEQRTESTTLKLATLAELYERPQPEIEWLVQDLLPTDSMAVLSSKPKAGKSTLLRCLAHCVASGTGQWLGRQCASGSVLHLALEERPSTVIEHYRKLGTPGDRLYVLDEEPPPKIEGRANRLEAAIRDTNARLVIIDTAERWLSVRDWNDYGTVTARLTPYLEIRKRLKTCILLVHHSRKSGGTFGDEVSGSAAVTASMDIVLSLDWPGEHGNRTLYGFGRDGVKLDRITLEHNPATDWISAGGSTSEIADSKNQDEVRAYLCERKGGWIPADDIARDLGGNRKARLDALKALVERGGIKRTGQGVRNDPFLYSVLPLRSEQLELNPNPNNEQEEHSMAKPTITRLVDYPAAADTPEKRRKFLEAARGLAVKKGEWVEAREDVQPQPADDDADEVVYRSPLKMPETVEEWAESAKAAVQQFKDLDGKLRRGDPVAIQ